MLRFLFLWGIGGARSSGGEAKVLCGVCSTLYGSPPEGGREGKGKERKEGACTAARSARAEGGVTSAYVCRTESARSGARIAGAAIDARDGAFGEKEKESADRVGCC